MMLEDSLSINARRFPDKIAVTDGRVAYTYAQLLHRVMERAGEFAGYKGRAFPFRVSQDAAFVVDYFALHIAGCVAVPLARDYPEAGLDLLRGRLKNESFDAGVADIMFTTGTTGVSKGVMISHDAILADAENLAEAQQFSSELTFIICGPLNHIGSLSKIYPSVLVGATIYIMEGMKDIEAFFRVVEAAPTKVASFMVPTTIRMVMTLAPDRLRSVTGRIDFIETGAAPMSESDMHRFASLLPEVRLYNTYASTETGIVATYDYNHGDCIAGCLGSAMKNSRIGISPEGKVVCSGRTLMLGYWNDKSLTDSVLYDGAVHTNDIACIDARGRLRLEGRDDDTINIWGYKVAPTEIEDLVMSVEGVADCICIAAGHKVMGNVLKLLIVPEGDIRPSFKKIAAFLGSRLESYKIPRQYEYVEKIERTYNGKLNRKAYR